MYKKIISILIITCVIYLPMLKGFFQHDEWMAFIKYYTFDDSIFFIVRESFKDTGHFVPLFRIVYYLLIRVFGFNYQLYALLSIVLHLITVYLSYILYGRIFKKDNILKVTAVLFFAFNAAGHQATTWPLVDINIHGATIFGILSLIYLFNNKFSFSILFLTISLLFKESTVGLFLFAPLMILVFTKNIKFNNYANSLKYVIAGAAYFTMRVIFYKLSDARLYYKVNTSGGIAEILKNLISFPIKVLYETMLPPKFLLLLSQKIGLLLPDWLTGSAGTTRFDIFKEQTILPILGISIVLSTLFIYWKNIKKKELSKYFFIGLVFTLVNSFVYVLSPGRTGSVPVIDSRNLYFPLVGTSIFVAVLLKYLFYNHKKNMAVVLSTLLIINIFYLRKEIVILNEDAKVRKHILTQIKTEHPILPEKVIFYIESDRSYYGLPDNIKFVPFQTNFGLNLFAWFSPNEKFSNEFLINNKFFLYEIPQEGYMEAGGRGFGYFMNIDNLKEFVNNNLLLNVSFIAYRYNSNTGVLAGINNEIENKLK